jgi:hypothetical protein
MMMWSHIKAMTTKPGFIPKNIKEYDESKMTKDSQYYELIKLRETIYHEGIVRKKIRKQEIPSYEEHLRSTNISLNQSNDQRTN